MRKPLAGDLKTIDRENMAYIQTVISEVSKHGKIVIAWGSSHASNTAVNESKKELLEFLLSSHIGNVYHLIAEMEGLEAEGTHILFLGLRYAENKWQMADYPVQSQLEKILARLNKRPGKKEEPSQKKEPKQEKKERRFFMSNLTWIDADNPKRKRAKISYECRSINGERKRKSKTFPPGTLLREINAFRRKVGQEYETSEDLDIQVILTEVTKAHDQTPSAVCLRRPEHNVSRLFYPGEYYGTYCRGMCVKEIAEEILETFQNDAARAELELRIGILNPFDFTKAKRRLYCRLINFDRSRNYLKNKCFIQ